jgi:hypothetical protein
MNELIAKLVEYIPTIAALLGIVVSCSRTISASNKTMSEVRSTAKANMNELKDSSKNQLKEVIDINKKLLADNYELKLKLNQLIESQTRVRMNVHEELKKESIGFSHY